MQIMLIFFKNSWLVLIFRSVMPPMKSAAAATVRISSKFVISANIIQ
jgi:hypothetical protein